jgi:hypothetical protein
MVAFPQIPKIRTTINLGPDLFSNASALQNGFRQRLIIKLSPCQSNFGPDLSSSATAPILFGAPLGGESERTFFAFFKFGCRKAHGCSIWREE